LAGQLEREQTPEMRDAIFGALSSFIKGANFTGKRKYIDNFSGLEQLSTMIQYSGTV